MIHHWKGLDFENTDFEYHRDQTYTGEIIPSQTVNLKHVEIIKVLDKTIYYTYWKGLDLEITDFEYHHEPTSSYEIIPSQTSNH